MRKGRCCRRAAVATLAMLLAGGAPLAGGADGTGSATAPDLAALSMEDLFKVEVSSVSRKEQALARTPAAVYVISQDEIRRSGATSVPELLRMVPGVQVARVGSSQWAVTARGFNSRIANKMLVLIDGRSVYNNLYSGVFWEQNDVMLEDVERIEVIRGPGATMWGANAVNGVINVITKKAKDTQGGLLTAGVGQTDRASGALRYGGHSGEKLYYRSYAKYFERSNMANLDSSPANDHWNAVRGGGRLDWQPNDRDSVTVEGDAYHGNAHQSLDPTAPFDTGVAVPDPIDFSGGFVMTRWERRLQHSDFALQTYYNRESRVEGIGAGTLHTVDFDFQHHIPAGPRNDLMWGVGYRVMEDHLDRDHTPFSQRRYRDNLFSAFLQDDVSLIRDKLVLTLGSKIQRSSYTGVEFEPGVRLMWTPTDLQSFWASASRAARTPSVQDRDLLLWVPLPASLTGSQDVLWKWMGNPDFRSEILTAYEAGYRRRISRRVSLDVAGFVNRYRDLQSMEQMEPSLLNTPTPTVLVPFMYGNALRATSYGVETSLSWSVSRNWRLQGGHTWLNGDFRYVNLSGIPYRTDANLHAPRTTFDLRSSWDLWRRWTLDTTLYYVSQLGDPNVPQHARLDLRVGRKLGESAEISAGVDDLTSSRHLEFVPDDYVRPALIRRSAYLKMIWSF